MERYIVRHWNGALVDSFNKPLNVPLVDGTIESYDSYEVAVARASSLADAYLGHGYAVFKLLGEACGALPPNTLPKNYKEA